MPAVEVQISEDTEAQRIVRWRQEELERAGYGVTEASQLAARSDVDLHVAVQLLAKGCPQDTALRILL
jgi:hypothetical protein